MAARRGPFAGEEGRSRINSYYGSMSLESERGAAGSLGSAALSGIRIPGQAGTVPGFHVGERVLVQLGRSHVGRSMSTATVAFLGEVRAPRNTSAQLHAPPPSRV